MGEIWCATAVLVVWGHGGSGCVEWVGMERVEEGGLGSTARMAVAHGEGHPGHLPQFLEHLLDKPQSDS